MISGRRRGRVWLGLISLLAASAAPAGLGASVAQAAPPLAATFNPSMQIPGSDHLGEPSIKTDSNGNSFVIGPSGFPTGGCVAFKVDHNGSTSHNLGHPDSQKGGGDCDWAFGPKETSPTVVPAATDDLIAYSSLLLSNITTGKSDNAGASFSPPNTYSQPIALDDRMWNVADPRLNGAGLDDVFMTYHDLNTDQIWQVTSTDGGVSYFSGGANPVINPSDVTTLQWAASCPAGGCVVGGPAILNGNELGNIVARRPTGGALTLYSIFTTPDSAADNQSGTGQNRVYAAVGTVVDAPGTLTPQTITWHDYEIYHGPVGDLYNKIFPVTAVDAAGHVYAVWADSTKIYERTSVDGVNWGCSVNPTTPGSCGGTLPAPSVLDTPGANGNPAGTNTAIMPWIAAGANGGVDVVWYGAHGGSGANQVNCGGTNNGRSPENDPCNVWAVYMAQTIDGFANWTVFTASDHDIHRGVLCTGGTGCTGASRILLDFFQVAIDPTNGAADIAYTDDHLNPRTNATLYFTRQCTGSSVTTLLPLVNDCVAPPAPTPPPPFGSTCPGPQIVDTASDAPNSFTGGSGQNMDNLDITNVTFNTVETAGSATELDITMMVKNLTDVPDTSFDPNLGGAFWSVHWTYNGAAYEATATGTGSSYTFTAGADTSNEASAAFGNTAITGVVTHGPNGTLLYKVTPLSLVGSPANGALLTLSFADTHGAAVPPAAAGGVYYTASADAAPDGPGNPYTPTNPAAYQGYGADYVVGQVCSGTIPEAPVVPAVILAGLLGLGLPVASSNLRRRRRGRLMAEG